LIKEVNSDMSNDRYKEYDDYLDDMSVSDILSYPTSYVVKEVDPIAYEEGYKDYMDAYPSDEDDGDEPTHVDYPHEPGRLYDCPACEAQCHCDSDPGHTECVYSGEHNR
jgi:hypothetical protein